MDTTITSSFHSTIHRSMSSAVLRLEVTEGYGWIRSALARDCCWCCRRAPVRVACGCLWLLMSTALPRCPVAGCGEWKHHRRRAGSSSRRWYSVDSNRHLLVGQLDEALAALPCNDHICPNCYKRIRRLPPLAHNLLDELTAAADQQPPTPPPPPSSPSSQSAPHPPPTPPLHLHLHHHIHPEPHLGVHLHPPQQLTSLHHHPPHPSQSTALLPLPNEHSLSSSTSNCLTSSNESAPVG